MARRPSFTIGSFLAHIFRPSKNPPPTGIRKRTLKGLKGQSKGRIRSFNRMSGVNQQIIRESGHKDEYLRGETSFRDIKKGLRDKAVQLGVAKPVRPRTTAPTTARKMALTPLDRLVQQTLRRAVQRNGKRFNERTSDKEIWYLDASDEMTDWEYPEFRYAGRKGSEYEKIGVDGITHNPFWYH